MACRPDDREGAVREVTRVYELIRTHQPLLLHDHHQGQQEPPSSTTQLVQRLLGEALRALNIALSVMKQQRQQESSSIAAASAAADSNGAEANTPARNGKRRPAIEGGKNSSWVKSTPFPYDDGYEWRKYGEKRISGTDFTKSYFRCTYKDDKGCLATKYVQQKDNSDPPEFQVTYSNDHTCNCNIINNLPTGGAAATNNPPAIGRHDVMVIEQEAAVVLPTLADVPAIPLDDLVPCDEPFPIADQCVAVGVAGDNSCIPVVSCDELDMGQQIMTEPLIGDDPELQDLDLLLLCNSFKYW
ncbi:hypothetical protein PR202_gb00720 [Eleusine coracana subsp. coracana]|uniref:WRKY domain-containing protein n=1 Tax=Eleusine coracana subsp. coracana TaxID=191504 RepID=A0AAV5DU49_ELECO|nr:hypothetical protein QOZ80_5BG0426260 [Eleusine coracana subsp. coracana]GJN13957.1 hypothetical protein PR202_gb00720 [Eleusine coracana subsp. coracana]